MGLSDLYPFGRFTQLFKGHGLSFQCQETSGLFNGCERGEGVNQPVAILGFPLFGAQQILQNSGTTTSRVGDRAAASNNLK